MLDHDFAIIQLKFLCCIQLLYLRINHACLDLSVRLSDHAKIIMGRITNSFNPGTQNNPPWDRTHKTILHGYGVNYNILGPL